MDGKGRRDYYSGIIFGDISGEIVYFRDKLGSAQLDQAEAGRRKTKLFFTMQKKLFELYI